MNTFDFFQIFIFAIMLTALTPFLGSYMAKVFAGERHLLTQALSWLEQLTYKISGVDEKREMNWRDYAKALLIFNFFGLLFLFVIQLIQNSLPLNPQNLSNVSWHSSLNTAISFITNTNWQGYAGEVTMSFFTQMLGLTVQNFLSAATGIAAFIALTRGLVRKNTNTLGNFWTDLVRSTIYILLPLSIFLAFIFVGQGVVQNFSPHQEITTLDGGKQIIPSGPAASQIAIKQLGSNGGGFFNANSAHPFENPTPLTNFLQMLALVLIPAALTWTYGKIIGSQRQGWVLFIVMFSIWVISLTISIVSEYMTNPIFYQSAMMEGKEQRLGIVNSLIWSTTTTMTSNGSVNSMHSSLSPLAGGGAMFNIMLGEVIFGGVGSGLYGMLLFVLMTVFLSGLMVGRSPEYLGKKIEAYEMKWVVLGILGPCVVILLGTGVSSVLPMALSSLANRGPHGFSEILYAFTSAAGNNGSAFAGLNANTVYFNLMLGFAMLIGRFIVLLPVLAIAGSLAKKKISPATAGTFSTDSILFAVLLIGVIIIVGALTFLPALSLGPIVEHFLMINAQGF